MDDFNMLYTRQSDLSKVQISEPEEKSRTTVETVRCSICDEISAKSVLRGYDSGQWARQNLQQGLVQCCSNMGISRCDSASLGNKILAGGDHHHCYKCSRAIPQSKSLNNIVTNVTPTSQPSGRYSFPEDGKGIHKKCTEATIKYKNVNFRQSDSFISLPCSNGESIQNDLEITTDIVHRPITCPISDCRKMIARASILQHFIFDHSKVPRMTLNLSQRQRVYINISAITKELRCYAVFLLKMDTSSVHTVDSALTNGGHKNASFLLMGVRVPCTETIKEPHGSKGVSIRHVQTQTEPAKSSKVSLESKPIDVSEANGYIENYHNVILLWICKLLNDLSFYYTISIKRPDRKLAYSFTGESLNIGDIHDLSSIHRRVECFHILEKSSIKLMNEQNELEVTVNIFK